MKTGMKKGPPGREDFGEFWLPERPFATDDLGPMRTMTREQALLKRNIQANRSSLMNLLLVDIDDGMGGVRALEYTHGFSPAWVAEGRNGHAHAAWRIKQPVATTQAARHRPRYYAITAQEALRRKTGGDPDYKAFMTKNPLSEDWDVHWGTREGLEGYTLNQMESYLRDAGFWPEKGWYRKDPPASAVGRNCAVFDETRQWAYQNFHKFIPDLKRFGEVVENYALSANLMMYENNPLPTAEVLGVARSITRWIGKQAMWRNGKGAADEWFHQKKSRQGRAGATARWGDPAARDERVRQLIERYGNDA